MMALNDPSALGAMAALQEHGLLENTAVYGVDGAPEAKSMTREGVMTATAAQSRADNRADGVCHLKTARTTKPRSPCRSS